MKRCHYPDYNIKTIQIVTKKTTHSLEPSRFAFSGDAKVGGFAIDKRQGGSR